MYRLTTISLNELGDEHLLTWSVAFWTKEAATRTGDNLMRDGIDGFGPVISYRITAI